MIAKVKVNELVTTNNEKVEVQVKKRNARYVSQREGVTPTDTVVLVKIDGIAVCVVYCDGDDVTINTDTELVQTNRNVNN